MFECCCDRLGFVLGLQVLVCDLKDILLFFPFLLILPHVTWGQKRQRVGICNFYTIVLCNYCVCLLWSGSFRIDHTCCSLLSEKHRCRDCSRFPVCLLQSAATWFATHPFTHKAHSLRQTQRILTGSRGSDDVWICIIEGILNVT